MKWERDCSGLFFFGGRSEKSLWKAEERHKGIRIAAKLQISLLR
jgi:hypothetical protein